MGTIPVGRGTFSLLFVCDKLNIHRLSYFFTELSIYPFLFFLFLLVFLPNFEMKECFVVFNDEDIYELIDKMVQHFTQ